jgi:predicted Zn-dependent peptidase
VTHRKDVLPNGISIVTEVMPHVRSVAVGIWVDTGSRVEPEERGGISHLIEHLVFKGTETRSAEDIARAIDSVGGQMDAFTAKEQTCFYVSVLDEHLPLAVDLLADILRHPRFTPEDIEKEKAVVLQEIKMVEDTADDLIHDLFVERFWAGHPLGRPILGRWNVVQGFDRAAVLSHLHEEYAPAKITIAVAGHMEHARVVDLFAGHFEGFDRPARRHEPTPPTPQAFVDVVPKPLEQVHLVMGFPGIGDAVPERYALYLLNDVIGGSMSSRLFQEVRERQGLAYSVHSGIQSYRDSGLFYVYAGTDAENFGKVVKGAHEGAEAPEEGRDQRGRAPSVQGPSQGQPDAVARVDLVQDEPPREAGDALRLVPLDRRDARRDRRRATRRGRDDAPSGARRKPACAPSARADQAWRSAPRAHRSGRHFSDRRLD